MKIMKKRFVTLSLAIMLIIAFAVHTYASPIILEVEPTNSIECSHPSWSSYDYYYEYHCGYVISSYTGPSGLTIREVCWDYSWSYEAFRSCNSCGYVVQTGGASGQKKCGH